MECASEMYTKASILRDELYEEKIDMLEYYLYYRNIIFNKYQDSRYLEQALIYNDNYFKQFIDESCIEHDFYILIMDYLASLEYITDCDDQEFINSVSDEFDHLEDCFEQRAIYFGYFRDHLDQLINDNILTNSNYLFINYPKTLTILDQIRMHALINTQKNKGIK